MTKTLIKLANAALKLPPKNRFELMELLGESLEDAVDKDADVLWNKELDRRLALRRSGKMKYDPIEKVIPRLRKLAA